METIPKAKVFITEQSFFVIWMVVEDIFIIIEIDVLLNATHVLRPQLHCVADKLDLSPENFVVYFAQKGFFLFLFDLLCILTHVVQHYHLTFFTRVSNARSPITNPFHFAWSKKWELETYILSKILFIKLLLIN